MQLLTADQILHADDLPSEVVEVPEWGGLVRVRGLTGAERDQFEASVTRRRGTSVETNLENVRAKLCALCIVDASGNRLFSDEQIPALGRKSGAALSRVFAAAQRLSGMTPADVEELTKELKENPFADSSSGSPSSSDTPTPATSSEASLAAT